MPVFIERFLIVVCAAAFYGLIINNTMSLDLHQRISLGVALVATAYFLGHTSYKNPRTTSAPTVAVPAGATGSCNGVNTGNGGNVSVNCGDTSKDENKP